MQLRAPALLDTELVRKPFEHWLGERMPGSNPRVERVERPSGSGGSAENLLVTLRRREGPSEVADHLVLRTAPGTYQVIFESDLVTQFKVLTALAPTDVRSPFPLWIEEDPGILGMAFMVMTRLPGAAPSDFPTYHEQGFIADAPAADRHEIWLEGLRALAAVARVEPDPFAFLERPRRGATPLLQMLAYLEGAAVWAYDGRVPQRVSEILSHLSSTIPKAIPAGLSWGDARMGNLLFDRGLCTGVLDWESASLAGPLVDLGWWLLFDRLHAEDYGVPRLQGLGDRLETVDTWAKWTKLDTEHLRWHEILAAFALLVRRQRAAVLRGQFFGVGVDPSDPRSVSRLLDTVDNLLAAS